MTSKAPLRGPVFTFFVVTMSYCNLHHINLNSSNRYGGQGVSRSTVVFQMVSSIVLVCCFFAYPLFGLLSFNGFTSQSFLRMTEPILCTAIPVKKYKTLTLLMG